MDDTYANAVRVPAVLLGEGLGKVKCDRIRQRPALHACSGMDDHAGRFVYNGEKLVLVNDIEGNILGLKSRDRSLDEVDLDIVVLADLVRWLYRFVVDENVLVIDQPLQSRTRPAVDVLGKIRVETHTGMVRINDEVTGCFNLGGLCRLGFGQLVSLRRVSTSKRLRQKIL